MRQQRVGVDGIRIFLVAGEQEQALAVQTGREVLPAQLHDIVAFTRLWLAGRPPGSVAAKAQLFEHLPLSRFRRPDIGAVRGGGTGRSPAAAAVSFFF